METQGTKRKLAAILNADVAGYSRLMRDDEAATVRTINIYRELMARLIQQHHGRIVDSPGDNVLAEFASVVDAVQSAVAIQKEIKTQNSKLPNRRRMEFRIGINLGDIIMEGERIYGDGVNIAARLEGLADSGGICISRTAYDQIEDKLPLGYQYLGEKTVKNMPKPIRAYRVILEPQEISSKHKQNSVHEQPHEEIKQEVISEKYASLVERSRRIFKNHLYTYLGVNGFFIITNVLTYAGNIWFHWLALSWGLVLFLHWRSSEFASSTISPRSIEEPGSVSPKKRLLASILCFFFGVFGVHRFYAGKIASGCLQVVTIGGLGIWYIIDLLILLFGEFTDSEGKKIKEWL